MDKEELRSLNIHDKVFIDTANGTRQIYDITESDGFTILHNSRRIYPNFVIAPLDQKNSRQYLNIYSCWKFTKVEK